jgi:hypothetical protein
MIGPGPRVMRGAFVEYGLSFPPVVVPFQFNPVQLQRTRSLSFRAPNEVLICAEPGTGRDDEHRRERDADLRTWHRQFDDLTDLRDAQIVSLSEESVSFELRLDATDELGDGNIIAAGYGIGPRLAVLEQMTTPKDESLFGAIAGELLGPALGHQFTGTSRPPLVLFVWGVQRVVPVNITELAITETEFDTMLNPIRATVAVALTVIAGGDGFSLYTQGTRDIMSVLHLANLVADIVVPG